MNDDLIRTLHILDEMEKIREILEPFTVNFSDEKRSDLESILIHLELLIRDKI